MVPRPGVLIGKMAVILLRADGAEVQDLTDIPGSAAARQAMLGDQIQVLWEDTGIGWLTHLGHDKPIGTSRGGTRRSPRCSAR